MAVKQGVPDFFGDPLSDIRINYKEGGGGSEREILRANNRNAKTFNDFTGLLNYNTALEDRAKQFETDFAITAIMSEQQRSNFARMMQVRESKMNSQLEAYGKSADQTAQQLKFNQDAAKQGLSQAEQVYVDRLKSLDFGARGQEILRNEQLANLTEQYISSEDQLAAAQTLFGTATAGISAQYTEETRYSEALKTLADEAADRDYNTTESIAKDQKLETILNVGNQFSEAMRAIRKQNKNALTALEGQTAEADRAAEAQAAELRRTAGVSAAELVDAATFRDQYLRDRAAFDSSELKTATAAQVGQINDDASFQAGELTTSSLNQATEIYTSSATQRQLVEEQSRFNRDEGLRAAAVQASLAEKGTLLDYETRVADANNAISNEKANMQTQVHRQQIDQLISSGSVAAKGKRGTTAKRALQSLGVLSSVNQAQMISSFIRFRGQQTGAKQRYGRAKTLSLQQAKEVETAITNQLTAMYSQVGAEADEAQRAARARADELLRSSGAKAKNITDTALARTTELTRSAEARATEATTAAAEQGAEALRSANVLSEEQKLAAGNRATELETSVRNQGSRALRTLKDRNRESELGTKNTFGERVRSETKRASNAYAAAIAQAADRRTSTKDSAKESKLTSDNRALNAYNLAGQQAVDQLGISEDRIATQQIALAERVGIINMRTELSLEELGESMISAMDAFNDQQQNVFMQQFQADSRAVAAMMAKPEFADAPDAPFIIPEPEFVPPVMAPEAPKVALPPSPPTQSGLGKALQIAGAIVSVAAAPFTGGASVAGIQMGAGIMSTAGSLI